MRLTTLSFILLTMLYVPSGFASQKSAKTDSTIVRPSDKRSDYDFRKTRWGDSRKQVQTSESAEFNTALNKGLFYKGTVLGMDVSIAYIFAYDSLVRAKYSFRNEHSNKNAFLTDYQNVKEALTKKYGAPIEDKVDWINDLFRDEYQRWGTALAAGHLRLYARWRTKTTEIIHLLDGDNYKIRHATEYSSTALEHLEEKAEAQKAIDDF